MALIAPFARMIRSTNRSTPAMAITGCQLQNVTVRPGREYHGYGRQAGDVVDLDCPPFFIDRAKDAVPPGPQAAQVRRPIRERRRRPRLMGELLTVSQSAATPMESSLRKPAAWTRA